MSKNILTLMAAALLCTGLAACGGGSSPINKYCDALEKGREKMYDGKITNGELVREIKEQFIGQQLTTEIDGDVLFEIVEPFKVINLSPLYGGIEFEALVKSLTPATAPPAKLNDYVFIACNNNEPIKVLNCDSKWNEDESYTVKFFLNVGNILQGSEKADDKLRTINKVVITEYGSELFVKISN